MEPFTLPWREFQIHLESFNEYLLENYPSIDGLLCDENKMTIVPHSDMEITAEEKLEIENYYYSLNEVDEGFKINRPARLAIAYALQVNAILLKDFSNLTILDKKIVMRLSLTREEEDELLEAHS